VCAGTASTANRCVVVGGLKTNTSSVQQIGIAYYCLPLDVFQYAFQWPGMETDSVGSGDIFPQLPGMLVSLHVSTTWAPQLGMRDSVVAVVHVRDTSTSSNSELLLEPLTQVLLFSPNRPVPLLIMRTSMRSERQLDVDIELPKSAGFLHKVEHVQIDVADSQDSGFVVQVRGYTMRRMRVANSEQMV
jgi:hypothetical protein